MVDSVVFCQLLLYLLAEYDGRVVKPCRGAGLVRADGGEQWAMLCATRASISYSLVACGEDPLVLFAFFLWSSCGVVTVLSLSSLSPQTFPYARDIPVELAPLDEAAHQKMLAILQNDIERFLRKGHEQLLEQLSPLVVCQRCLRGGGDGRLTPGSFSQAELEALTQQNKPAEVLFLLSFVSPASCSDPAFLLLLRCSAPSAGDSKKMRQGGARARGRRTVVSRSFSFSSPPLPLPG